MVGGEHQQLRITAVALRNLQGGCGNRRGSIAAKWLEDKVQLDAVHALCAVIIKRAKKHLPVGYGQQRANVTQAGCAGKGLLQQALTIGQAHKGLGHGLARHWP